MAVETVFKLGQTAAQKGFDGLQRLVGRDRCATLLDRRNKLDDIALADLMDALVTPNLANLTAQEARDLASGGNAQARREISSIVPSRSSSTSRSSASPASSRTSTSC